MAPLPPNGSNSMAARPPIHPVPQLQGPFEESLMESVNDSLDEYPPDDSVARRAKMLDGEKYERVCAGRWKQRPGEKFHPLWKISAQMSFGMHLLAEGLAKSDGEVMQILQSHVDDIDGFLERTTEDFDLAQSDVRERLRYLKLPLEHVQVFDHMLEDRTFRASIVQGNEKIEHIVARTSKAMKDALKDVQKGLDATNALGRYLADLGESWKEKPPEHEAVFVAMVGNVEGWARVFMDLHLQGNKLAHSLVLLDGVVAEVQRRVSVASRKALLSSSRGHDAASHTQRVKLGLQSRRSTSHLYQPQKSRMATPVASDKPLPTLPDELSSPRQTAADTKLHEKHRKPSIPRLQDDIPNNVPKYELHPVQRKSIADLRETLSSRGSAPALAGKWRSMEKLDQKDGPQISRSTRARDSRHDANEYHPTRHESPPLQIREKRTSLGRIIMVGETAPIELPAEVPQQPSLRQVPRKKGVLKPSIASKIKENPDYLSSANPLSTKAITVLLKSSPSLSSLSSSRPSTSPKAGNLPNHGHQSNPSQDNMTDSPEMVGFSETQLRPFITAPTWFDLSDLEASVPSSPSKKMSPKPRRNSRSSHAHGSSDSQFEAETNNPGESPQRNSALTSHPPRMDSPTGDFSSSARALTPSKLPALQLSTRSMSSDLHSRNSSYYSSGEPGPAYPEMENHTVSAQPAQISELEGFTPISPLALESGAASALLRAASRSGTPEPGLTQANMRSASDFLKLPPRQTAPQADSESSGIDKSRSAQGNLVSPRPGHHCNHRRPIGAQVYMPSLVASDGRTEAMAKTTRRYSDLIDFLASTPPQSPIHARSPSNASSRSGSSSVRGNLNMASASKILAPPDEAPPPPAPGGRSMVSPDFASAGAFEGERKLKTGSSSSSSGWKKMFAGVYAEGKHGETGGRGSASDTTGFGDRDSWFKGMGRDGVWVSGN